MSGVLLLGGALLAAACSDSGDDSDGTAQGSEGDDPSGMPSDNPAAVDNPEPSNPNNDPSPVTPPGDSDGFLGSPEPDATPVDPPELTDDNACAGLELAPEEIEIEVPVEREITTEVPAPIAFYIVLDNSQSMTGNLPGAGGDGPGGQQAAVPEQDGGAPVSNDPPARTRWELAVNSLSAFVRSPDSEGIDVAIQYFNPVDGDNNVDLCDGVWHSMPDVPISTLPEGAEDLVASLEDAEPDGFTPTVGALAGGVAFCEQFQADNPDEDCVVVLVTDGLPRSCGLCEQEPGGPAITIDCYDPMAPDILVPIAEDGFAAGVRTFTVGMDGVPEEGFGLLDAIAVAGGTDCTPAEAGAESCNVSSSGSQGLVEALNSIRDSVVTTETVTEVTVVTETQTLECQWIIPDPPAGEELDPDLVNVTLSLGGADPEFIGAVENEAACAASDGLGWYYDDPAAPTMITACEASCDAIENGVEPVVEVLLGCEKVFQPDTAR